MGGAIRLVYYQAHLLRTVIGHLYIFWIFFKDRMFEMPLG